MSKEITKRIDFWDSEDIFDLFDCRCTNLSRKCVDQVLMCDYFNKTIKGV